MSQRVYVNNFKTTLSTGIAETDTTIPVVSTAAVVAQFPSLGGGQTFLVTIDNGTSYEIVQVGGISGNTLTSCVRGREGTAPMVFTGGTRVESRVTAGTLAAFARLIDRVADIASLDVLPAAASADANSYLCADVEDYGNPITTVRSGSIWKFPSHPLPVKTYTLTGTGTSTSVNVANTSFVLSTSAISGGAYVIQFLSGANQGLCRKLTNRTSTTVSWTTALPSTPFAGDVVEIYQSASSTLAAGIAAQDDAVAISLIFNE